MHSFNFEEGEVLLIDKPLGWTSFDAVNKIRGTAKIKKVGHAGTLDPLATGLLVICTGKKTKSIQGIQDAEKEYTGEIVLGKTTPSFDLETSFDAEYPIEHITDDAIYSAAQLFVGDIAQVPPVYSAIKVNGTRAYNRARRGQETIMQPRMIAIMAFEITHIQMPSVFFRLHCSKGTYVRSLAHDFGKKLGSGAYLASLRRTKIGELSVEQALTMDKFISIIKPAN